MSVWPAPGEILGCWVFSGLPRAHIRLQCLLGGVCGVRALRGRGRWREPAHGPLQPLPVPLSCMSRLGVLLAHLKVEVVLETLNTLVLIKQAVSSCPMVWSMWHRTEGSLWSPASKENLRPSAQQPGSTKGPCEQLGGQSPQDEPQISLFSAGCSLRGDPEAQGHLICTGIRGPLRLSDSMHLCF